MNDLVVPVKRGRGRPRKNPVIIPSIQETDEEIKSRITERFSVMEELVEKSTTQNIRSLVISGPAGIGKSYTAEKVFEKYDPNSEYTTHIKGYVRATGLYRTLYDFKFENNIILMDDADTVFGDETSLNILKAALDTQKKRTISWLSEASFEAADGSIIPRSYEYDGTMIFLTNYDFYDMISRGHKLAPHLEAIASRSVYIDLGIKTRREYMVRINQVLDETNMLKDNGFDPEIRSDITNFMVKYADRLRDMSLRQVLKLAALRTGVSYEKFESLARVTALKNSLT